MVNLIKKAGHKDDKFLHQFFYLCTYSIIQSTLPNIINSSSTFHMHIPEIQHETNVSREFKWPQ